MKIIEQNPDDLTPYKQNAKIHDEKQIAGIAESIRRFGFVQPIVVDKKKIVVIGHGRLAAAKLLNLKTVPTVDAGKLTAQEIRALRILDNKLNESPWDNELLRTELETIKLDFEPFNINFETNGVKSETKEDDFETPELEEIKTEIKRGDLIRLGVHQLLCGDATDSKDFANSVNQSPCDTCFTSPPYNAGDNSLGGNKIMVKSKYLNSKDDLSETDYLNLLIEFTKNALSYCSMLCINLQSLAGNKSAILKWAGYFSSRLIDRAIWYKGHGQPQQAARVLNSRFEDLFFFSGLDENPSRALPRAIFHGDVSNVYEGAGNSGTNAAEKVHAATMPMHLPMWVLGTCDTKGKTVCDPFLGSGTTLIAADQLGRICYGMEIEPKYCQVIVDRYRKYCADSGKECIITLNGKTMV